MITLELPPLRERKEDIESIANYFIKRFCKEAHRDVVTLSNSAIALLQSYNWPGNIRELENCIESTLILHPEQKLIPAHFDLPKSNEIFFENSVSLQEISAKAQKIAEVEAIKEALLKAKGNKSKAAKMLQVSYKTLLNKIKDYAIA